MLLESRLRAAWNPPARARLVPHANYHVTLRFIGDVSSAEAPALLAAVAELDGHALECATGPLIGFPRPARARVVALGLRPSATLLAWAEVLAGLNSDSDLDTETDTRTFLPHVTLARIRGTIRVPELDGLAGLELNLDPPALFESVPVNGGVRYQPVEPAPFRSD